MFYADLIYVITHSQNSMAHVGLTTSVIITLIY